jgi:hypothetical protein
MLAAWRYHHVAAMLFAIAVLAGGTASRAESGRPQWKPAPASSSGPAKAATAVKPASHLDDAPPSLEEFQRGSSRALETPKIPDWQQPPARRRSGVRPTQHAQPMTSKMAEPIPPPGSALTPEPMMEGTFDAGEPGEFIEGDMTPDQNLSDYVDGHGYSYGHDGELPPLGPDFNLLWGPPCHFNDCGFWGFLNNTSIFGGAHAFKGPLDGGQNGNFGFHDGVNFAGALSRRLNLGYQIGGQWVHSNFSGSGTNGGLEAGRDQIFLSAGVFHRAEHGHGWQGGAVFDRLEDDYYVDVTVTQVRGEVSYLTPCRNEIGFWGAFATADENSRQDNVAVNYEAVDMYNLFYRRNLPNGGEGRVWGGATGDQDGMLGADFRVPMSHRWELVGGFNYLIPEESSGLAGATAESWGLTMSLVWYPGRPRLAKPTPLLFRPLFNVADNNTLMVQQARP